MYFTDTYYNATSNRNVTTTVPNFGSGQICQTATAPFNGFWDPCPWIRAAYDCSIGPLSGFKVWNRLGTSAVGDVCSIDCKNRISKFTADVVYKNTLVTSFPFTNGNTTVVYDVPLPQLPQQ